MTSNLSQFNVKLPDELIAQIRDDAETSNTTVSRIVRKILVDHYQKARR